MIGFTSAQAPLHLVKAWNWTAPQNGLVRASPVIAPWPPWEVSGIFKARFKHPVMLEAFKHPWIILGSIGVVVNS